MISMLNTPGTHLFCDDVNRTTGAVILPGKTCEAQAMTNMLTGSVPPSS